MRGPIDHLKRHVAIFVVGIFAALGVFLLFLRMGDGLPEADAYKVKVAVPTSASLVRGSRVTMSGVEVGRIARIQRQGFATVVDLEITDDRVAPMPEDSQVTLRQRTPVGENYIELSPGDAPVMLANGGALPISQSDEYVDVDQLLSVLSGKTKQRAQDFIQSTGGAIEGRGDELNRTVGEAAGVLQSGARVFERLSEQRQQVATLVDRLGKVAAAVGERGESVRVLADRGVASLEAVAERDQALSQTLAELPATLSQVRETSGTLSSVSRQATPVVSDLAQAVDALGPAMRELRPAAQEGRRVVTELRGAAPRLEDTLTRVRGLSNPLSEALPQLEGTACDIAPMVRYLKPYTNDAIMALVGLGSASNSYDSIGHLIRLSPIVGENSLAGAPDEVTKAAQTLLRTGLFAKSSPLSWNPYPEAGMIGKDQAGPGETFSGPKALAESGYEFPRIKSDC